MCWSAVSGSAGPSTPTPCHWLIRRVGYERRPPKSAETAPRPCMYRQAVSARHEKVREVVRTPEAPQAHPKQGESTPSPHDRRQHRRKRCRTSPWLPTCCRLLRADEGIRRWDALPRTPVAAPLTAKALLSEERGARVETAVGRRRSMRQSAAPADARREIERLDWSVIRSTWITTRSERLPTWLIAATRAPRNPREAYPPRPRED